MKNISSLIIGNGNETMNNYILSDREKDALQEAGNIAAAYAATALSQLVGESIIIDVTECKITKVDQIPHAFGEITDSVVAINMVIPSRKLCSIVMIFPKDSATELCDMFTKKKRGTTKKITENEINALTEIGNICICAYLNAISRLLDIEFLPSPPAVACDMVGSILEDVAISADAIDDFAILIETNFIHKYGHNKAHLLFIPDLEARDAILRKFKA